MKTHRLSALAAIWLFTGMVQATPLGTAFTYQGNLTDAGAAANANYDMTFTVFDAGVGGNQIGPVLTGNDISVADGLFTTTLDFGGSVFPGGARWLEIAVRPGASAGNYTPLLPRQPLNAAPYALFSAAPWISSGSNIAFNLGNVGIGTGAFTPTAPLDVRGTVSGYGAVQGT